MQELFRAPLESPLLLWLTVSFFFVASITTFTKRVDQAKKAGTYPPEDPEPPWWVGIFIYIEFAIKIALFVINWKYGILVYVVGFVLALLPVLETVGNILLAPFKPKRPK